MSQPSDDAQTLSPSAGRDRTWSLPERVALLRRFARDYLVRYFWRLAFAAVCLLAYAGTVVALPLLFERLVNGVLLARDGNALTGLAVLVLGLFAARALASFMQQYQLSYVANAVSLALQRRLADHMLGLDLAFFTRNSIGQLIGRATDDVNVLNRASTNLVVMAIRDVVTLVGLLAYAIWSNPLWFLLGAIAAPLLAIPVSAANRRMRALSRRAQDLSAEIIQAFDEGLHAVRSIKAEDLTAVEQERLGSIIATRRQVALQLARTQAVVLPIVDIVTAFALVLVMLIGGGQVVRGETDPGTLAAFAGALLLAYDPLRRLLSMNAQLQAAAVSIHRIYEILDRRPVIVDRPGALPLARPGGTIRFEDVWFSYSRDTPVLRGFSAEIPEGATVAIVGPSGSGKTSLFNLAARLYEPDRGRVTIGGEDVREVTLASLRGGLALVSQDVLLFDASVADNIAYGNPGVSEPQVEAAARLAEAHDFIAALPGGYGFRVGPRGSRLSGGQRQRIALARALLRDSPLLLLDEATSALDSESERRIQLSLATVRAGRTTLIIAHRLATVTDADRIYVLDEGRVVEQGTHRELVARAGRYAETYSQQVRGAFQPATSP